MALSLTRANQRNARALHAGFLGGIALELFPVNAERLTFNANVTFTTGDQATPNVTFTPCDDLGRVRTFTNVDDLIKWVNGAFFDVTSISMTIAEADKLSKPFVPPTDTLADANRKKAMFTQLKLKADLNLVAVTNKVTAEVAAGNNLPTAHPALQAIYGEFVKQQEAVQDIVDYYANRIAFYNTIIAAANGG